MQNNEKSTMLKIKDLTVEYRTDVKTVYALNGINLEIKKGTTLGLVGETGAGKTTIAKSIMRLLPERTAHVLSGEILLDGEDLLQKGKKELSQIRGKKVSMIFQDPMSSLNPIMSIGDQIKEALQYHNHEGLDAKQLDKRVDEILKLVNIPAERKHEYPNQFSGGMKQRAVIAIALSCEPELLIADEPTTALDVTIQAQVLMLMRELIDSRNTSMLMITHDLGIVAMICDYVAVIYGGEVIEYGTAQDIYTGEKHHPYTKGLFGSIPNINEKTRRLHPIEGVMLDPTHKAEGCSFAARCPYAKEVCFKCKPAAYAEGEHTIACHLYADKEEKE